MTGPSFDGPTVSVERAADLLGCKRTKVFDLLKRGLLLRAPRFGRETRIPIQCVLSLAVGGEPATAAKKPRTSRRKAAALAEAAATRLIPIDPLT